jgi:hypothetical protein
VGDAADRDDFFVRQRGTEFFDLFVVDGDVHLVGR